MTQAHGTAPLGELIGAHELRSLRPLHVASMTSPVRDVALVTDIEDITSCAPDTVVLLTAEVAKGGWMISAALRYAWERRACALIVPERSFTATVIELARRLGISLFSTAADVTRMALDVAIQIGVARAGSLARIQAFVNRISRSPDLESALGEVARELGGATVCLETGGAVAVRAPGTATAAETSTARLPGDANEPAEHGHPPRVAVTLAPRKRSGDMLVAEVAERADLEVERVLRAAIPSVRSLLAHSRLDALRDSLPTVSVATVAGARRFVGLDDPRTGALTDTLWPMSGSYVAVCVIAGDQERVGTAVHHLWSNNFPDVPLARVQDGWIGFVPVSDNTSRRRLLQRMEDRLERSRVLDLMVGVSRLQSDSGGAARSVREAWFAARMCSPGGESGAPLVAFDRISASLPARLLPAGVAEQIAAELFPALMGDPGREDLIRSVVALLDHHGSSSAAAAAIGVHRNTLQVRLRRAAQLGVDLTDPAATLSTHLLLAALARSPGPRWIDSPPSGPSG